jgi:ring-1,2-phenylacetyl-CoA epoxidase subunit PaaE
MHLNHNYVVLASQRGIEPLMPTLEALLGRDPASRVQRCYGNRNREEAGRADDLLALKDRYMERFALHFIMSDEPQEIEWLNGEIDAPKLTMLAGKLFDPKSVRTFLICGPGAMNQDLPALLGKLGVESAHIHVDPYPADTSGTAAQAAAGEPQTQAAGTTEVTVIMDGRRRTFPMRTETDTILDAAADAGIDLPFSCKAGVCSTCRTKLLSGKVELAQNFALEDWELEQGFILACQAHAKTPQLEITYDET